MRRSVYIVLIRSANSALLSHVQTVSCVLPSPRILKRPNLHYVVCV
ncbi:hypothetical protein ANCDUO_12954 [Ancylostoma duodenale]|uniref:Uncharacterized protein n=1 Tax=Ancylostoma duodenale TaxID=51022 RepID=A0A0C2D467_9BILA|nr:hypothetical protein ANCDUO_12954 [Ancylostoma duodenale]